MKTIRIHLFLISLLAISGCKKHDDYDGMKPPLLIPDEVKSYSLFQPGTYWVYIDSVSERVDSVYVYETSHSYDTVEYFNKLRVYEIYVVKMRSAMDGYDYIFEVNTTYSYNKENMFDVFHEKYKPGDYVGRGLLYLYPPVIGQDMPYFGTHLMVKNIINSYIQNGVTYADVIQIYHDIGIEVSKNVTNFIARDYGIIRKEYADSNQVWKLTRSHIIQ